MSHFFKKETALSFFLLLDFPSRTCSMPQRYILGLSFANRVKYYLILKTFCHFKTQREKLCSGDVNHASVL